MAFDFEIFVLLVDELASLEDILPLNVLFVQEIRSEMAI